MRSSLSVLGLSSPVIFLAACATAPDSAVLETGLVVIPPTQDTAQALPDVDEAEHHDIASLDADGDGYTTTNDCNDANAAIHPGATELDDLVDQDCDNYVDEDFVNPGDLVISEINRGSRFGASTVNINGSWVEVTNTSSRTVDLSYWIFARGPATGGVYVRVDPASAVQIAPGGRAVFCDTNDYEGSSAAYPLSCDYVWGDETKGAGYKGTYHDNTFYLHIPSDTITLLVDGSRTTGVTIDEVTWASGWPSKARFSMSLDPAYVDSTLNDDSAVWCSTSSDATGAVTYSDTWRWYDVSTTTYDEYGTPGAENYNCQNDPDVDGDGYDGTVDCNDGDPTINPAATETCDGVDEDCDGIIDDGTGTTVYYRDADGDSFGDAATTVTSCAVPSGYTSNSTDCNDASAISYPGSAETCDGLDNNCDGYVDEGGISGSTTYYLDADADGYGTSSSTTTSCLVPSGYSAYATDCDDAAPSSHPGASELDDVSDNDCDGYVDEDYIEVGDLVFTEVARTSRAGAGSTNFDALWLEVYNNSSRTIDLANWTLARGTSSSGNAVVLDATAAPVLAPGDYAVFCDTDNYMGSAVPYPLTCDYVWGDETKGSGYKGTYHDNTFYLHTNDTVELYSGGNRTSGLKVDGLTWTYDATNGYWPKTTRFSMSLDPLYYDGTLNDDLDAWCNTSSDATGAAVYDNAWRWYDVTTSSYDEYGTPGATNFTCLTDADMDGDGYGHSTDCDDTDPAINPGATETCNSIDDDCDGSVDEGASGASTWYQDGDSDTYGNPAVSTSSCTQPSGYVSDNTDCDDAASYSHPGATEVCDGEDNDCDTTIDEGLSSSTWYQDSDSDSYGNSAVSTVTCSPPSGYVPTGGDCDDTNAARNPGETEICDGVDNDCDASIDEGLSSTTYADLDADGYGDDTTANTSCSPPSGYISTGGDCDDSDGAVNPGAVEVCGDGIDNDCTGGVSDCEWSGSQKVSDQWDFRAFGPDASESVGHSIANNGDFDGDGYDDVAVGRAYLNIGSSYIDEGRLYLWYGPVDNTDTLTSADVSIDGDTTRSSDYFSSASRFIQDMDGDGDDELIVGAYASHSNDRGTAYLFKGGTTPTSVSSAFASFSISTSNAYVGWKVDDGDIDGDLNGDVLISAYGLSSSAGAVDVWKAAAIGGGAETFGTDGTFHLTGAASGDQLGYSAEIIDDVDGDGKDDLLIGAPAGSSSTSAGKAYLVYGADALSGTVGIATAADATITGLNATDRLGMAVAGIGDVDNDGNFDFLVTADKNDAATTDAGAAYIFTTHPTGSVSASTAASILTGEANTDYFGRTASGLGDVNADGFDDFAVGATAWDLGTISGAGCFYVMYGPLAGGTTSMASGYDLRMTGSNTTDAIGYAVTGGGDVNADGYDDFMTSATSWDAFGLLNAGAAWLYYGKGI